MRFSKQIAAKKITERAYHKLHSAVQELAGEWKEFFIEKFNETKTGKTYFNTFTGQMYTASAAGEYPAQKSGNFLENLHIFAGSYNPKAGFVRLYFRSDAEYTEHLANTRKLVDDSIEEGGFIDRLHDLI